MKTRRRCNLWWPLVLLTTFATVLCSGRSLAIAQDAIKQNLTDAQKADLAESLKLNKKSFELFDQGEIEQATELVLRVLAIRTRVLGADHPEVAASLNNLATLYDAQGNKTAAKSLYERALAVNESALGPEHPDVAICLKNLANFHVGRGDASTALPLFQRALSIRETALGPDHRDTLAIIDNLASLHKRQGRYAKALSYYQRVLDVRERTLGANHPATANSVNRVATVYDDQGDYATAEKLYRRALAITEKTRGEDHSETATRVNNLAHVLRRQGNDAAALPLYQRALQINRTALGPEHPGTALNLNNLASLYEAQGNSEAALPMFRRALEIREQTLGAEHPDTAQSLNNLAMFYQRQHSHGAARPLHGRALAIREKTLGADHPLTAASLNNLAGMYDELGDIAAATPLYERALAIYEKSLGPEHSLTAHTIHNIALLHEHQGQTALAQSMYSKAISIFDRTVGNAHPGTTTALANAAKLTARLGQVAESAKLFDRSRQGVRRYVSQVLPGLSEREQTLFLEANYVADFHAALSLAIRNPEHDPLIGVSASWLVNGKAVAEEALAERNLIARDAEDPALRSVVRKMLSVRSQLASLAMTRPATESSTATQHRINRLTAELRKLQQQLTSPGESATNTVAAQAIANWVDIDQVRSALPENAVLIDIARVNLYDFAGEPGGRPWSRPHYVAWLTHGSEQANRRNTVMVDLGSADEIDDCTQKVRRTISSSFGGSGGVSLDQQEAATASARQELQTLAKKIWQPLEMHLGSATEIVLSPDGSLWLAPWSALPLSSDGQRYLIEQYELRFVVNGRALLVRDQQFETGQPVILANPSFDQVLNETKDVSQETIAEQSGGNELRRSGVAGVARIPRVQPLPNTLMEALAIRPEVEKYTNQEVLLYEGRSALESVATLLRRPTVATFATHGFFLPRKTPPKKVSDQRATQERNRETDGAKAGLVENPLLRCGLLLAGCNQRGSSFVDDDGILTGLEIVGIDFRGTKLVVLSACETGVGDVRNGEGVAGLRQAFQLAGAQAVMATLWQIPDRESAILISSFFKHLADGESNAAALRSAQIERIEKRRQRYGAAHPFYWAAFTLTGK